MTTTQPVAVPPDAATTTPELDPRRWGVLGVLCLSLLLIVMDNTIVNVALPTIQEQLGATTSQLQWLVDAYILVFAGLLLTMGSLGDRFGRKGALSLGLAIAGLASLLAAMTDSVDQLIATRALLGVGGALIMPATLSILINVFTEPKERAKAIALWAATSGVAAGIGPVTGGYLLEHFWWGSVFFLNVPVVVIALVAGRLLIPTSRDPEAPQVDIPGALLSIAGLVSLVWAIIEAPQHGWTDPSILGGFAVAAVLLSAFALWERHTSHPMLDLAFFTSRRFSAASAAITLTFFAMFGSLFLLTQFLQFVMGYDPLQTGVRLLPMAGVMMLIAPNSARLAERFGSKVVVAAGLSVAGIGLLIASQLTAGAAYGQVALALMVIAAGMALTMAPATESIMGSLPPAKAGVGSAVNDTTRELGGAIGVAVLGSLLASHYSASIVKATAGAPIPAALQGPIKDSVAVAMGLADKLGGAQGAALRSAAGNAFVDGMGVALIVAAGVAFLGAVIVAIFLPARAPEDAQGHMHHHDATLVDIDLADVTDPAAPDPRPAVPVAFDAGTA